MKNLHPRALLIVLAAVLALSLGANAFGYYYFSSSKAGYQQEIQTRDDALASYVAENTSLKDTLQAQIQKNDAYGQQVSSIATTVDELSKLSKLDPQLLAKYSKVYFLNENYVPAKLATITPAYTYNQDRTYKFEADALPFLMKMLNAASSTGNPMLVISAYRSFGEQAVLKSEYKMTYGAGTANSFSADQGYSEHQLGTTVDLTTKGVGATFRGFDKTDAYQWLLDNAYKYGFILSYPQDNGYYVYEPWHWRFVGIKLATMLHVEKENFYDVDQRQINPYLITIFDAK